MPGLLTDLETKKGHGKDSQYSLSQSNSSKDQHKKEFTLSQGWGGSGNPIQDAIHNANGYKQAVVLVMSFGKSGGQSSQLIDYMSQEDSVDLFNEEGVKIELTDAKKEVGNWVKETKKRKGSNRYTMHLSLSGDKSLTREQMVNVTKDFIKKSFEDHYAIYAIHTDKELIHSHVSIKMTGHNKKKIAANKTDLKKWRAEYAEILRRHGVKASATSRSSRGIFGKSAPPGLKIVKELYNQTQKDSYQRRYDQQWTNKWIDAYKKISIKLVNSKNNNLASEGKKIQQFKDQISAKTTQPENESRDY
jgi:hypothetical protein